MPKSQKYEKVIAFCISRFFNEVHNRIINYAIEEGRKRNWKVQILSTLSDLFFDDVIDQSSAKLFEMTQPEAFDAIVIMSESFKTDKGIRQLIARAAEKGIPVVSIDKYYPECINLRFDNKNSFESVVRHMIEDHGYVDHIFLSGVPGNIYTYEREMVYKKVLKENQIEFDEKRVIYGGYWEEPTRIEMEKFFKEGRPLPKAFICANDDMALSLFAILEERGIKVPEDVAVSGFDGLEIAKYSSPRLTTVANDYPKLFATAYALLSEENWKDNVGKTREILIPLSIGHSCGCDGKTDQEYNNTAMIKFKRRQAKELAFKENLNRMIDEHSEIIPSMETLEVVRTYMEKLAYTKFYACVSADLVSELTTGIKADSYDSEKMVSFCFVKDDSTAVTRYDYSSNEYFIPNMADIVESEDSCMVIPMHVGRDSVGYAVLIYDEKEISYSAFGACYTSLLQLLNLQRKQAIINRLM